MSPLLELWSVLTPAQRLSVVLAQMISLVMACSTVGGIAAIAPFFAVLADPSLIDRVRSLQWLYAHAGVSSHAEFVVALGVAFIGVVLFANLVNVLGNLAMNRLALRIGTDLQTSLFAEYLSRPYGFHTRTNSTILFNNVVHEPPRVTYGILQQSFTLMTSLVTAVSIVLSIALVQPIVAVTMLGGLAGGYALIYLAVRNRLLRAGRAQSRWATDQARIVGESLGAIKEVIVLQAQDEFRDQFRRASGGFSAATAESQVLAQSPRHIMECIAAAGLVGLALLLGTRADGVGPWLGQLSFLALAAYRLLPALQQVFAAAVRIRADRAGLSLIAPDLLRARVRRAGTAGDRYNHAYRQSPEREIRLIEVSFRHLPDRPRALSSVSLRIPAQAAVGIVGVSGSGKTTLVDVISGLLVPDSGRVEIDGVPLSAANRADWYRRIAYVPQQIYLLDASIAQNVALGVPARQIDRERLDEAIRLAQLDELVGSLPLGYEHRVGERGVALSGGQRQRVGIARALYRDASVLLLDEATNALDGLTERELMDTLHGLRGRYTSILIAHRMSTVRECDVIFQLEQGEIVGSGTYDRLLNTSESFRHLVGSH